MQKNELGSLRIIGLGPGNFEDLSIAAYEALEQVDKLFLRTIKHPVISKLKAKGIEFISFDRIYEQENKFEDVYQEITRELEEELKQGLNIGYGVPGNPLVAEKSVQELLSKLPADKVEIISSASFLDPLFIVLNLDPITGIQILDALSLKQEILEPSQDLILTQVYNSLIAGDLKLTLLELYPAEHQIQVVRGAGIPKLQKLAKVPLYQLDRLDWVDHLTTVHIPPLSEAELSTSNLGSFKSLVEIMHRLRGAEGCPWDLEQTHDSLRPYLIEESYEVLEEIEKGDMQGLCEELGDLLLQVVFHAQIAKENANFEIEDVILSICEKMIRRHPHVFSNQRLSSVAEVIEEWEQIKSGNQESKGTLDVTRALPSLMEAQKIQEKVARVGFDWKSIRGAIDKFKEEWEEFEEALQEDDRESIREELGDLLFTIVNVGRFLEFDLELVLRDATQKFKHRFSEMENRAQDRGCELGEMSLDELEELWEKVKK